MASHHHHHHHSRDFSSFSSNSPNSPGASFSRRRERSCSPSSRYGACSSPTGGLTSRHSFSTSSLTRYGGMSYPKVSYNKRLLTPLNLDLDPSIQAIRVKEKEDIKTLNNQFAALIGKVQSLEQHNQVLLTRWNFLREQDNSLSDLDIKLMYDQYMNKLRQQIRSIDTEKEQLDMELDEVLEAMDSFRSKYEDEINKRSAMEFTFMTLKKDLDQGFLHKTELEAKLNGLHAMAELMKTIHDQELDEAMSQIKDISIVLGIDNYKTNIDPHRIVEDVRAQYEALAVRSWEELEALTRSKLSEGEAQSAKYGDHLLNDRRIIAELNIQIQKMRSCILSLKSQCLRLEGNVKEVGAQGEATLNDARAKLANLEEALQNLRQDLAHLVKEYQELMNIKLALDIEILTYRELMEGEEISMESPAFAFISRIYSGPKFASANASVPTTSNVAPRARENSTDRMSHIRGSLESGLSRSQSGGTEGTSGGDFSRSHSNTSGEAPKGFKNSSTTSRGTLESSFSSSRSGNFADVENTTRSSISKSHGSESFSQTDIYSNRSGDNLGGRLSRSTSRDTSEGSLSRSQSNRSGGLTDSVFARTPSGGEGVSVVSLSRSHSGTSAFFVEGGLSRSQSNENEELTGSNVLRTNNAEDGGVPVGGLPRSQSRASTGSSEGRLSRSQSGKNETLSSQESVGYVEPTVSRTNSAEDGGVPVGGISRSHSEVSRYRSEGSLPRSQSDGAGSESIHGKEKYVEPLVSRTNRAEDGGVPVGGIPGSRNEVNRYSPEHSIPKLHSGDDAARSNHGKEAYAQPAVYRTDSAGDAGASVNSISGSHIRDNSADSLSRSLRDQIAGIATVLPRAHSKGTNEGSLSGSHSDNNPTSVETGASRSQSDTARGVSAGSGFRTPSVTSAALTDSVFTATPSIEVEHVYEEMLSRVPAGTTESVPVAGLSRSQSGDSEGPVETSTPICYSSPKNDAIECSLSSSHSGEGRSFTTADFSRSLSETNRGVSEAGLSRSYSKENDPIAVDKISRSDSYITAVSHHDASRTFSSEAESPSGGIEAPVGSPVDENKTITPMDMGRRYSHEEGLSGTPSRQSTSSVSTYLVDEVHSDNLHYTPAEEVSYHGEFSPNH